MRAYLAPKCGIIGDESQLNFFDAGGEVLFEQRGPYDFRRGNNRDFFVCVKSVQRANAIGLTFHSTEQYSWRTFPRQLRIFYL